MAADPVQLGDEQARKARELAQRTGMSPEDVANRALDQLYEHELNGLTSSGRSAAALEDWQRQLQEHIDDLPRTSATDVDASRESTY